MGEVTDSRVWVRLTGPEKETGGSTNGHLGFFSFIEPSNQKGVFWVGKMKRQPVIECDNLQQDTTMGMTQ